MKKFSFVWGTAVLLAAAPAWSQVVISAPTVVVADIHDDVIVTGGTAATPVVFANSLIDGDLTVSGGFAVRTSTLSGNLNALTVTGDLVVTEGGTYIQERPDAGLIIQGDLVVENAGLANFLPTLGQPTAPAVVEKDLVVGNGGGGFFNRMTILGDVACDGAFSTFLADTSQVAGDIDVTDTSVFSMETTGVAGDVNIKNNHFQFEDFPLPGGGAIDIGFANIGFFTANLIEGDVKIMNNTGGLGAPIDLWLGNPQVNQPACFNQGLAFESTTVLGDVKVMNNDLGGSIVISNNQVGGNMKVMNNRTARDLLIGATQTVLDLGCDGSDDFPLTPLTPAPDSVGGKLKIKNNQAAGQTTILD